MNIRFATITLLVSAIALAGCKTSAPEELPIEPGGYPDTGQDLGQNQGGLTNKPLGGGIGTQIHFEQEVAADSVIYFDTDRYNIDSADAAAMQVQAQYLLRYSNVIVTVEGHCDERGTRDYNLALGERRANAAKNYLIGLGVDAARIRTVSYGKERPAALGSDQSAWAQNRRAVTMVIG